MKKTRHCYLCKKKANYYPTVYSKWLSFPFGYICTRCIPKYNKIKKFLYDRIIDRIGFPLKRMQGFVNEIKKNIGDSK